MNDVRYTMSISKQVEVKSSAWCWCAQCTRAYKVRQYYTYHMFNVQCIISLIHLLTAWSESFHFLICIFSLSSSLSKSLFLLLSTKRIARSGSSILLVMKNLIIYIYLTEIKSFLGQQIFVTLKSSSIMVCKWRVKYFHWLVVCCLYVLGHPSLGVCEFVFFSISYSCCVLMVESVGGTGQKTERDMRFCWTCVKYYIELVEGLFIMHSKPTVMLFIFHTSQC